MCVSWCQVDLTIAFDASVSGIRNVQRRGRTGRKRAGRCINLMAAGREEAAYEAGEKRQSEMLRFLKSQRTAKLGFYSENPRMLPDAVVPRIDKLDISVSAASAAAARLARKQKGGKAARKPKPKPKPVPGADGDGGAGSDSDGSDDESRDTKYVAVDDGDGVELSEAEYEKYADWLEAQAVESLDPIELLQRYPRVQEYPVSTHYFGHSKQTELCYCESIRKIRDCPLELPSDVLANADARADAALPANGDDDDVDFEETAAAERKQKRTTTATAKSAAGRQPNGVASPNRKRVRSILSDDDDEPGTVLLPRSLQLVVP